MNGVIQAMSKITLILACAYLTAMILPVNGNVVTSINGSEIALSANITDPDGLGAFTLSIKFNPSMTRILKVESVSPFYLTYALDNSTGILKIAGFHGLIPGPKGSVKLAVIEVSGSPNLTVLSSKLIDTSGDVLSISSQNLNSHGKPDNSLHDSNISRNQTVSSQVKSDSDTSNRITKNDTVKIESPIPSQKTTSGVKENMTSTPGKINRQNNLSENFVSETGDHTSSYENLTTPLKSSPEKTLNNVKNDAGNTGIGKTISGFTLMQFSLVLVVSIVVYAHLEKRKKN